MPLGESHRLTFGASLSKSVRLWQFLSSFERSLSEESYGNPFVAASYHCAGDFVAPYAYDGASSRASLLASPMSAPMSALMATIVTTPIPLDSLATISPLRPGNRSPREVASSRSIDSAERPQKSRSPNKSTVICRNRADSGCRI